MPMTRRDALLASAAATTAGLLAAPASAQTAGGAADRHSGGGGHAATPPATAGAEGAAAGAAPAPRRPAPRDAYVYIGWPSDGATVSSGRTKVWFGTRNFGVAPAGVAKAGTGHHHLLIDAPLPPFDREIPNDARHLHFGLGQTETVIDLPPGTHTLQLLMGDENHVPHDPPVMSKRITVHARTGRPAAVAASQ